MSSSNLCRNAVEPISSFQIAVLNQIGCHCKQVSGKYARLCLKPRCRAAITSSWTFSLPWASSPCLAAAAAHVRLCWPLHWLRPAPMRLKIHLLPQLGPGYAYLGQLSGQPAPSTVLSSCRFDIYRCLLMMCSQESSPAVLSSVVLDARGYEIPRGDWWEVSAMAKQILSDAE